MQLIKKIKHPIIALILMILLTSSVILSLLWTMRRQTISLADLTGRLSVGEIAVAADTQIAREFPTGSGGVRKNNTLVIFDSRVIRTLDEIPTHDCWLIIADDSWVSGQISVANATKQQLGLSQNLHAILPSNLTIFKGNKSSGWIEVDRCRINYFLVK